MLRIVIQVDCPACDAQGAKELIAMRLEDLGICRVVEVSEITPKQMSIGE